ncbi:uncharacterized protein Z519_10825 [Cladophialophora bantiana CBS 173.52]|uniref:GPI inositol-deacylase n=1 Tax=Cladophialophora bantiana (strain ATCC 10958 / CBS 173.52 / CDC B-1940 / NIH 8579) TaxID=1442370 RepID=A0A0D2H623_CLAB1|nr:uncharacterized protein Z519_10825 [Cladophialophora bantiana CBS 173.52]KIW88778.1 hypothetical protein Z519_10825 [Cladophialophora bantiana CBS 173.52]
MVYYPGSTSPSPSNQVVLQLGKLRSRVSYRNKRQSDHANTSLGRAEDNLATDSSSDHARRESSGPVVTLSAHRLFNTSSTTGNDGDGSSFASYDAHALGLHVIYEPDTRPIADIIFVHGLGGHSYKTWCKDRNLQHFWPGLWLSKDPKIGKARLFTYGYDSQLLGPKSVSNIMGFARSLLFDMRYSRGNQENSTRIGDAPIIFVAHSMGGLVVKKAYLMAQNDQNCTQIAHSILGIIFLSTPHRGSNLTLALNLILRATLQSEKSFIKELERNSSAIEDINDQFRHVASKLSIVSFYEEHPTLILRRPLMIVRKDSAILGYQNEESRGLPADHHTICKFASDEDPKFRIVRDTLKGLVEKLDTLRAPDVGIPKTNEDIRKILGLSRSPVEDFNTLRKRWMVGSCEWFLQDPGIQDWLADLSGSHLIWYNAPPANGKSVLSSYVIQYLQSNDHHCQYYFFNFGDQTRRSISGMLKSLAYQISSIMPEYGKEIVTTCTEGIRLDEDSYHFLWQKLFENLFFCKTSPRPLFWVIDGLDESESPQMVIELLEDLLSHSRIQMKVLVTSRRTEALTLKFRKLERLPKVNVIDGEDQTHNDQDIKLVVDRELEYLHGSAALKGQLQKEILQRARGNFLWVNLVLEELHKCQTEREIRAALEQIPENMTNMYARMQLAIIENPNEQRVQLAKQLLQWVACVPRPLTLDELRDAISKDYPDVLDLKKAVRDVCGQFILIDSTSHVTTIHQTARDFLTKSSNSVIATNRQSANSMVLVKSLSSLSNSSTRATALGAREDMSVRKELEAQQPFAFYAANSWFYYLDDAGLVSEEGLEALERFFSSPHVLDWIYILAILDQVGTLARAGNALSTFVSSNRKHNRHRNPMLHRLPTLEFLGNWGLDLMRITAKYNKHLTTQPYAVYEIIPALCPPNSMINRQFHHRKKSKITVCGQNESWTDVFARFSLPQDETVSKIVSSGPHLAVFTHGGIAHIWSSTDFSEVCALRHGEPAIDICMNNRGDVLVTYGLRTTIVWDIPAGTIRLRASNPGNSKAMSLAFAMNEQRVLAATDDSSVRYLEITENGATWKVLNRSLLKENPQSDSTIINSPSFIKFNTTGTQVAVCYRSFPLTVWDLNRATFIRRCLRPVASADPALVSPQTWFPVELFAWNPVTGHIIGWYKGNNLFKWHPVTDDIHEVSACVDGLASSPNGKVFVTSDSNGVVKLWNFESFSVIYQLSSGDLVSGLSFSSDSMRFYDVRGSTVTAWEPSGLPQLVGSEETFDDAASDERHGATISNVSEANAPQYPTLTALSTAPGGLWYSAGNDDGEVYLADVQATFRIELTRFHSFQCVGHLVWSPSGGIIAAADLAADVRIIQIENTRSICLKPTDVRLLQRPKLALEGRAIHQMLLDFSSRLLLVISDNLAQTWDIVDCSIKTSAPMDCAAQQGWLNHPTNHELFLGVGPEHIRIYQWSNLQQTHYFRFNNAVESLVRQPGSIPQLDKTLQVTDLSISRQESVTRIHKVMLTQDLKHILVFLKDYVSNSSVLKKLLIVQVESLNTATDNGEGIALEYLRIANDLTEKLEAPLGILPGHQLIFLDRDLWVCSISLTRPKDVDSLLRHYFIPRGWTRAEDLVLCTMLRDGTLFCIQEGNIVTIRSNLGV